MVNSNIQGQQEDGDSDVINISSGLIHAEQIRLLYKSIPLIVFATIVNAVLLAVVLWNTVDAKALSMWLGIIIILMLWRGWNGFAFKQASPNIEEYKNWAYKFNIGVILTGIAWASVSIFLFPDSSIVHQVFIVFVLGGMTAGSIGTLSFQRLPVYSFLILLLLPIIVRITITGTQIGIIMGVMLTLYLIVLLNSARNFNETTRQNIALHIEAKEREEQMEMAVAEAESANLAKSQFMARMSHELRTPLNSILGFSQLLNADDASLNQVKRREYAQTILSSGWHLLSLVDDVLDLASIEANKLELSMDTINTSAIIQECVNTMLPLTQDRNITLEYMENVNCEGCTVKADVLRVKQILLNLLSNAVKYNREGGSVAVTCQETDAGFGRITVTDTGAGIAKGDQKVLFEPFSRLYLNTYATQGTGIGLSLSKHLVELMGGSIGVESQPGKGSTFWVDLKLAQQTASECEKKEPVMSASLVGTETKQRNTLLYIEDNPSHIKLLKALVEDMPKIHLLTAHTPQLGLEMAAAHKPDLIILDVCLPGMDGFEVLKKLQEHEKLSDTPTIALSANAMPQEVEMGLRSGFRRYFSKPIRVDEFKKAVKELLADNEI